MERHPCHHLIDNIGEKTDWNTFHQVPRVEITAPATKIGSADDLLPLKCYRTSLPTYLDPE